MGSSPTRTTFKVEYCKQIKPFSDFESERAGSIPALENTSVMVVICDFHSQGQGSIPCGGDSKDTNSNTNIVYLPNGRASDF